MHGLHNSPVFKLSTATVGETCVAASRVRQYTFAESSLITAEFVFTFPGTHGNAVAGSALQGLRAPMIVAAPNFVTEYDWRSWDATTNNNLRFRAEQRDMGVPYRNYRSARALQLHVPCSECSGGRRDLRMSGVLRTSCARGFQLLLCRQPACVVPMGVGEVV